VDGHTSELPHSAVIVALGEVGVCDGGHSLVVMKDGHQTLVDLAYVLGRQCLQFHSRDTIFQRKRAMDFPNGPSVGFIIYQCRLTAHRPL